MLINPINDSGHLNHQPHSSNKIALVCNPTAGKGRAASVLKTLMSTLDKLELPYESCLPPWPPDFDRFSKLWLIGGDGTLHYFLNQYPNIRIPLAIFKGGSGNDFAWKLYGNKSVEEYIEIAVAASPKAVDAGTCNGKYFINGVGIGFDGSVVQAMGNRKLLPGHLAYLSTVLRQIFVYKEQEMTITIDEGKIKRKVFMVSIANGSRYGGGFLVAPQAIVNDGLLDIVVIYEIAPLKRLMNLPRVEKGKHLGLHFIDARRGSRIHISAGGNMIGHLDGELMESTAFDITVLPGRFLFLY
jgi:diacylglycerol kinase (ATP)